MEQNNNTLQVRVQAAKDRASKLTDQELSERLKEIIPKDKIEEYSKKKDSIESVEKSVESETTPIEDKIKERQARFAAMTDEELQNEFAKITGKKPGPHGDMKNLQDSIKQFNVPSEKSIDEMSFSEKAGRAWNMSWASLQASMGGGMEFLGIEENLKGIEQFGKEWKAEGQRKMIENYMPAAKDFEFTDLFTEDFWATKAPTILPSALSLMAPAMVAGMVGTAATEASLAWLWPAALAEPTPLGEAVLGFAGMVGGVIAASGVSRGLEGAMEAGGVWNEAMEKLMAEGKTEEEAQKIAGTAAWDVFNKNWALAGMDALEFAVALVPIKGLGGITRGLARKGAKFQYMRGHTANVPKGLRMEYHKFSKELAKNKEVIKKFTDKLPPGTVGISTIVAQGALESIEEVYQAYIESNAMHDVENKPRLTWSEFLSQPETKEAATLGALGGFFFQSVGLAGKGIGNLTQGYAEKKRNERELRYNAYEGVVSKIAQAGDDKAKIAQIQLDYGKKITGRYVSEGKTALIKNELDNALNRKKISQEHYDQLSSHVDMLDRNYKLLPNDLTAKQKEGALQAISGISIIDAKIEQLQKKAKEDGTEIAMESQIKILKKQRKDYEELFKIESGEEKPGQNAKQGKEEVKDKPTEGFKFTVQKEEGTFEEMKKDPAVEEAEAQAAANGEATEKPAGKMKINIPESVPSEKEVEELDRIDRDINDLNENYRNEKKKLSVEHGIPEDLLNTIPQGEELEGQYQTGMSKLETERDAILNKHTPVSETITESVEVQPETSEEEITEEGPGTDDRDYINNRKREIPTPTEIKSGKKLRGEIPERHVNLTTMLDGKQTNLGVTVRPNYGYVDMGVGAKNEYKITSWSIYVSDETGRLVDDMTERYLSEEDAMHHINFLEEYLLGKDAGSLPNDTYRGKLYEAEQEEVVIEKDTSKKKYDTKKVLERAKLLSNEFEKVEGESSSVTKPNGKKLSYYYRGKDVPGNRYLRVSNWIKEDSGEVTPKAATSMILGTLADTMVRDIVAGKEVSRKDYFHEDGGKKSYLFTTDEAFEKAVKETNRFIDGLKADGWEVMSEEITLFTDQPVEIYGMKWAGIAGTPDLIAFKNGKIKIIDMKTLYDGWSGKSIYSTTFGDNRLLRFNKQTNMYKFLLEDSTDSIGLVSELQIMPVKVDYKPGVFHLNEYKILPAKDMRIYNSEEVNNRHSRKEILEMIQDGTIVFSEEEVIENGGEIRNETKNKTRNVSPNQILENVIEDLKKAGATFKKFKTEGVFKVSGVAKGNYKDQAYDGLQQGSLLFLQALDPVTYEKVGQGTVTDNYVVGVYTEDGRIGSLPAEMAEKPEIYKKLQNNEEILAVVTEWNGKRGFTIKLIERAPDEINATPKTEKLSPKLQRLKDKKDAIKKKIEQERNKPSGPHGIDTTSMGLSDKAIKIGLLQIELGYTNLQIWMHEMRKVFPKITQTLLNAIWNHIHGTSLSVQELKAIKEADEFMGESVEEEEQKEYSNGGVMNDGEQKAEAMLNTIRQTYSRVLKYIPERKVIEMLYNLTHSPDFSWGTAENWQETFFTQIEKLRQYGEEGKMLSDYLLNPLMSIRDLNQLIITMRSMNESQMGMLFKRKVSKDEADNGISSFYNLSLSNTDFAKRDAYKVKFQKHIEGKTDKEIRVMINRYFNVERPVIVGNALKEGKKLDILNADMAFLEKLTGVNWTAMNNSPAYLKKGFQIRNGQYINNIDFGVSTYAEVWEKSDINARSFSPALQYIAQGRVTVKDLEKSVLENLHYLTKEQFDPNILNNAHRYKNVLNKFKTSLVIDSSLDSAIRRMHTAKGKFFDQNPNVLFWRSKKRAPISIQIDGIKDAQNNNALEAGSLSSADLILTSVLGFIDKAFSKSDTYLQIIEQFGDKKRIQLLESKKYTKAEAEKIIDAIRSRHKYKDIFPTKEEMKQSIDDTQKIIDVVADKGLIKIPQGYTSETLAEEMAMNYSINKFFNDQYLFGNFENYKLDYITQVKRASSAVSPGTVGNLAILGEKFNHVIMDDVELKGMKLGKHELGDFEMTDGQTYILPEFSNMIYEGYGSFNYKGSLKGLYHEVDPNTGDLYLIKSHGIVLSDELIKTQPNLKAIRDMMTSDPKNPIHMATFSSGMKGAKKNVAKPIIKDGVIKGFSNVVHKECSFENYRMQLSLVHDPKLSPRAIPVQFMRHLLQFEESQEIVNEIEKTFGINYEDFKKKVLSGDTEKLLKTINRNIRDTERNASIKEMLSAGISMVHPFISDYVLNVMNTMFSDNVIEKKAYGGVYTSISLPGAISEVTKKPLASYRVDENGVVHPGEVLVPVNSGMKIGDKLFATRVPSSDLHNTAYSVVAGFLPADMENTIVMTPEMVNIAGEDFDGDQRYVWAKYTKEEVKGISNEEKEIVNKAFDVAEKIFQNKKYYDRITHPINTERYDKNSKRGDKEVIESLDTSEDKVNQFTLHGLVNAYERNIEGKSTLGVVANGTAVYSWVKKFGMNLKDPFFIPQINKDGSVSTKSLSEVDRSETPHVENGDSLNQSVDNAKLNNLVKMGLNKELAYVYLGLNHFGLSKKHVIKLMTLPDFKNFMKFRKRHGSPIFGNASENVYDAYAKRIFSNNKELLEEWTDYKTGKNNVSINSIGKDRMQTLAFLYKAENKFSDYNIIQSIIKTYEKGISDFNDLYYLKKNIWAIENDKLSIDTSGLAKSIEFETVKNIVYATDEIFKKGFVGTTLSKSIISQFEKYYNDLTGQDTVSLKKSQLTAIQHALHAFAIREALEAGSLSNTRKEAVKRHSELSAENNAFIDSLKIIDGEIESIYKQSEPEDINSIRDDFKKLSSEDQLLFAQYAALKYPFTSYTSNGNFAPLISIELQKEIDTKLQKVHKDWSEYSDEVVSKSRMKHIMQNFTDTIPTVNVDRLSGVNGVYYQTKTGDYPPFVRTTIYNNEYILVPGKNKKGMTAYFFKDAIKADEFGIRDNDVPTQNEGPEGDIIYKEQNESVIQTKVKLKDDKIFHKHIFDKIQKLYPGLKIFKDSEEFRAFVEKYVGEGKLVENKAALGAAFRDAMFINEDRAVQTSPLHELAHIYLDAISNKALKEEGLAIFNGDEEFMVESIALAGRNIEMVNLKGSALQKFVAWLKKFWNEVKRTFNLGNEQATYADMVARDMLSKADWFHPANIDTYVEVKYQTDAEASADVRKAREEYIIKKANEISDENITKLEDIDLMTQIDAALAEDLASKPGKSFRMKMYAMATGERPTFRFTDDDNIIDIGRINKVEEFFAKFSPNGKKYVNLSEKGKEQIKNRYEEYLGAYDTVNNDYWNKYNSKEKIVQKLNTKEGYEELLSDLWSLQSMDLKSEQIATQPLLFTLQLFAAHKVLNDGLKSEIGTEGHNPYAAALADIFSGENVRDLSDMEAGKWSWLSPYDVKDKVAQLRQLNINETNDNIIQTQEHYATKMTVLKAKIKRLAKKQGLDPNKVFEGLIEFREMDFNGVKVSVERVKESIDNPSTPLDKMLSEFLNLYHEVMDKYSRYQDEKKKGLVPRANADFTELAVRYKWNIFKVIRVQYKSTQMFDNVHIVHPDPNSRSRVITLGEYRKELTTDSNGNIITKAIKDALIHQKIQKEIRKIKKQMSDGNFVDAAGQMIGLENKNEIPIGVNFSKNEQTSEKIAEAFIRHAKGTIAQYGWTESLPMHLFFTSYMAMRGGSNYEKWMKMHDDRIIYGNTPDSWFGPVIGSTIQTMVNYTAWKYLVLNPPAAMFNLGVGVTSSFVHVGLKTMVRGATRMGRGWFSNNEQGFKSWMYSKGINIMNRYEVVHTAVDTEVSMAKRTFQKFQNVAFSLITIVEYFNYSLSFVGLMEDFEYDALDSNGNLLKKGSKEYNKYVKKYGQEPKDISSARITYLKDKAKEINGAYDPMNKRLVNSTPEGRAINQFKNWLPDMYLAHFGKERETFTGHIKKGIARTAFSSKAMDHYTSIFSLSPTKMRDAWTKMSEVDKMNMKKLYREFVVIGMLMLLATALYDDDDTKGLHQKIKKLMSDFMYIYDLENIIFLLDGPPMIKSIQQILGTVMEFEKILMGNPSVYKSNSKYGEKGEWKVGMHIQNDLPAQYLIKALTEEDPLPRKKTPWGIEDNELTMNEK